MPTTVKKNKYIEAVGRRKTSVARVRMVESSKNSFVINGESLEKYFSTTEMQLIVKDPLNKDGVNVKYAVSVLVKGGGIHSQSEAIRHGISRALVKTDVELRKELKPCGFLKRDPRMKERRKFGLKKARKSPQWSKR